MSKAKLIAISAMCAVVALLCLALAPLASWAMLLLGVVASIAVVIPIVFSPKNLVYTLLVYLVSSALGVFLGLGNIMYVAPIVVFCIPFAIVKVYGETVKITATLGDEQVLEDPFGNGDDQKLVAVEVKEKQQLHKVVRWVLYYILLEAGIGLTLLSMHIFTPSALEVLVASKWFYVALGVIQLIVVPYNVLMRGCLIAVVKVLHKIIK